MFEEEKPVNNTGIQNTSIDSTSKQAVVDDLPSIEDVLSSGGIFDYPLLEEFLGGSDMKPSILNKVEFVTGQFGESVGLLLKDVWYRTGSKSILDETKRLQESDNIPCRVNVAQRRGKTGRTYYTLRGGKKENE